MSNLIKTWIVSEGLPWDIMAQEGCAGYISYVNPERKSRPHFIFNDELKVIRLCCGRGSKEVTLHVESPDFFDALRQAFVFEQEHVV